MTGLLSSIIEDPISGNNEWLDLSPEIEASIDDDQHVIRLFWHCKVDVKGERKAFHPRWRLRLHGPVQVEPSTVMDGDMLQVWKDVCEVLDDYSSVSTRCKGHYFGSGTGTDLLRQ